MKKVWKLLLYGLASLLAVWLTARYLLPIGLPFLLGYVFARLAERPVGILIDRAHFPRPLASVSCLTLMFVLLGLLLWLAGQLLFSQAESLLRRIPALLSALKEPTNCLKSWLLTQADRLPDGASVAAQAWLERFFSEGTLLLETLSGRLLNVATALAARLPELLLFLLTAMLSGYFFSIELPALHARLRHALPECWYTRGCALLRRLRHALGAYLRAEVWLCLISCGLVTLGLLLLRVNGALLLGLLIALVDILPVLGIGTVLLPWSAISMLCGKMAFGLKLLLLYLVASLTRSVLEPRVVGKQMGLHPLLTLIAIYAGFRLYGLLGMLLLPIAIMVCKQIYDYMEAA